MSENDKGQQPEFKGVDLDSIEGLDDGTKEAITEKINGVLKSITDKYNTELEGIKKAQKRMG
jgi:hypothetical protein